MIGIIFISDLHYSPYLKNYTNILDQLNVDYEVLYWNREDILNLDTPTNYHSFDLPSIKRKSLFYKAFDFLKYRKWLINRINENKYDKLILLSTLSGMILSNYILDRYKNKYIFDIRDYSYELNPIYYNIEKEIIKHSHLTMISSKGFKNFLPANENYTLVHNFNETELKHTKKFNKKNYGEKLKVVFNGAIRYFEHQRKIIEHLKNDSRFEIVYHGTGPELELFIDYAKEHKISNIEFTGRYNNEEKYLFLNDADILNNSYASSGKGQFNLKYSVANKLYDGLVYKIPQLVEKESYMTSLVEDANIGWGLDVNSNNFPNELYNLYFKIEADAFEDNCDRMLKKVVEDQSVFNSRVEKFIEK